MLECATKDAMTALRYGGEARDCVAERPPAWWPLYFCAPNQSHSGQQFRHRLAQVLKLEGLIQNDIDWVVGITQPLRIGG